MQQPFVKRDGHHVTVGASKPLVSNFAPSGREPGPAPLKKQVGPPCPTPLRAFVQGCLFVLGAPLLVGCLLYVRFYVQSHRRTGTGATTLTNVVPSAITDDGDTITFSAPTWAGDMNVRGNIYVTGRVIQVP